MSTSSIIGGPLRKSSSKINWLTIITEISLMLLYGCYGSRSEAGCKRPLLKNEKCLEKFPCVIRFEISSCKVCFNIRFVCLNVFHNFAFIFFLCNTHFERFKNFSRLIQITSPIKFEIKLFSWRPHATWRDKRDCYFYEVVFSSV